MSKFEIHGLSKLVTAGVILEIKQDPGSKLFAIHGLSKDEENRHHWVFGRSSLREIAEWLLAFVGPETPAIKLGDKADPRTWDVIVTGPAS